MTIRKLFAASILFSFANFAHALDLNVSIDCYAGSDLQTVADNVIGKLGLMPKQILDERVAKTGKKASDAVSAIRTVCNDMQKTNVVDAYFDLLGYITAGLPQAPFISEEIKMGKAIIAEKDKLARHAFSNVYSLYATGTVFQIQVSKKPCSFFGWFCGGNYTIADVHKKIDALNSKIIYIDNTSSQLKSIALAPTCGQGCDQRTGTYDTIYGLQTDDISQVGTIKEAWVNIAWRNGQQSVIPIKSGSIAAEANGFTLIFADRDKWFEYSY